MSKTLSKSKTLSVLPLSNKPRCAQLEALPGCTGSSDSDGVGGVPNKSQTPPQMRSSVAFDLAAVSRAAIFDAKPKPRAVTTVDWSSPSTYQSLSAVTEAARTDPAGLTSKDEDGFLPHHWACYWKDVPLSVHQFLQSENQRGVFQETRYGGLPQHIACVKTAHLDIIRFHHEVNPQALYAKNNFGFTPLDLARKMGHEEAVRYLEQRPGRWTFLPRISSRFSNNLIHKMARSDGGASGRISFSPSGSLPTSPEAPERSPPIHAGEK